MKPIPKPDPKALKKYEAIADTIAERSGAEKNERGSVKYVSAG